MRKRIMLHEEIHDPNNGIYHGRICERIEFNDKGENVMKEVSGLFIKHRKGSVWVPRKEIIQLLNGELPKIVTSDIIIVPSD